MGVILNELQTHDTELQTIFENAIVGGCGFLKNNPMIDNMILGFSGGIDSCMTGLLANAVIEKMAKSGRHIGLIGYSLPIITNEDDEIQRARDAGEVFSSSFAEVDLSKAYMNLIQAIDNSLFYEMYGHEAARPEDAKIRAGNIKARMRMMYLYDKANKYNGVVLSTDNYTELLLGFWTLHGDVGDFGFLQELWKTEVYYLAEYLAGRGIATSILEDAINAKPTDGLGVSDSDLDQLLPGWEGSYREGYERVDKLLRVWENGELDDDWQDMWDSGMTHDHPVIERHLKTEFKRYNPINLDRLQLIGLYG